MGLTFNFSSTTTPTPEQVAEYIVDVEDEINQQTQHSWKEVKIENEFYDLPEYMEHYNWKTGYPIFLRNRHIKTLDSTKGDKIELWNGSQYVEWLTTETEGRANDYWMDEEKGILYLKIFTYHYHRKRAVRMTYRFGEKTVPRDIRKAAALMVAADILASDDSQDLMTDAGDTRNMNFGERITRWREEARQILANRTELNVM